MAGLHGGRSGNHSVSARCLGLALLLPVVVGSCAPPPPPEAISIVGTSGARVSVDSVTAAYDVNGLRVIQRPSYATDVVVADLYFLGGVQEVTPETAGIEALALRAAEYGTAVYPDTMSRFALAATGSHIIVEPERDWTRFGFRGVVGAFDSTWVVFVDRVMHPTLEDASVALVRSQMIREARAEQDSPDGAVTLLADSIAFLTHPYALRPAGNERSLAGLSPDIVRTFVATHFVDSRMLLLVVGNVSREQVERAVTQSLAKLPRGMYQWRAPLRAPVRGTSLTAVPRSFSTNYLLGLFHGPDVTSPDYPAFTIATDMLSSQLIRTVRVDRSLSYAAFATYTADALATGEIYVSTDDPSEVVPLIRDAIERRRHQWEGAALVDRYVAFYVTRYLIENQTNEAQAASLARAAIYTGDYREADRYMSRLRQVTSADLIRVARRYMHDIQFAYIGNRARLAGTSLRGI